MSSRYRSNNRTSIQPAFNISSCLFQAVRFCLPCNHNRRQWTKLSEPILTNVKRIIFIFLSLLELIKMQNRRLATMEAMENRLEEMEQFSDVRPHFSLS